MQEPLAPDQSRDLPAFPAPPPAQEEDGDLARLCKALAHPARVRIVEHLAARNRCVCGSIVELFPLAQSTVSQHLKALKAAGLVRGEVEGPRVCYCLDRERLARFKALAARLAGAEPGP